MRCVKLRNDVKLPEYATQFSAGADIFTPDAFEIKDNETKLIKCGFSVEIPKTFEIQIRPKSGLALKGITILNSPGTIDSDYRGEIGVILHKIPVDPGETSIRFNKDDKIAQMVLCKVEKIYWKEAKKLSNTERGEGGYGSTGR